MTSSPRAEQEVIQLADSHLEPVIFLQVALHGLDERSFPRISWRVRVDSVLPALLLPLPAQVALRLAILAKFVLLAEALAGGAWFLTCSATPFKGALRGVSLILTTSGTALKVGTSTFIRLFFFDRWSHTNVPLALRFSEKERVCHTQNLNSEFAAEAETEPATGSGTDTNTVTQRTIIPALATTLKHVSHTTFLEKVPREFETDIKNTPVCNPPKPFQFPPQPPFFHSLPRLLRPSPSFPPLLWLCLLSPPSANCKESCLDAWLCTS